MNRLFRRLPQQREMEAEDLSRYSAHSPRRDKKDMRERSPSIQVLLIFMLMCSYSAHYIGKIVQLKSNSSYMTHTNNVHPQLNMGSMGSSVRLRELESEVQSILNQSRPVTACRATFISKSYEPTALCSDESSSSKTQIIVYNPTTHDKFICNDKILLGPKRYHLIDTHNLDDCWKRPIEALLLAHSFPFPPTYENRGAFPGIVVEANPSSKFDSSFSSNYVLKRTMKSMKDPSSPTCDIQCDFETLTGINQKRYIYGTDWEILMSMEGEHYYPRLRIDENSSWKENVSYNCYYASCLSLNNNSKSSATTYDQFLYHRNSMQLRHFNLRYPCLILALQNTASRILLCHSKTV